MNLVDQSNKLDCNIIVEAYVALHRKHFFSIKVYVWCIRAVSLT